MNRGWHLDRSTKQRCHDGQPNICRAEESVPVIQDLDLSQNKLTLEHFEVWDACFWKTDVYLLAILGVE